MQIKAVITDFIDTLANAKNYSLEASRTKTAVNSFFQDYVALIQFRYNSS